MARKEKILEKIRKLLALSKSSNENEAAIALAMAQKLMREHRLSESDAKIFTQKTKPKLAQTPAKYVFGLIRTINEVFGVDAYLGGNVKEINAVFYGREYRVRIASYAFQVLWRQLQAARKEFTAQQENFFLRRKSKIAHADDFCLGWVIAVYEKVEKLRLSEEEEKELQEMGKSLVDFLKLTGAKSKKAASGKDFKYLDSFLQGMDKGKEAQLNAGMDGWTKKHLR